MPVYSVLTAANVYRRQVIGCKRVQPVIHVSLNVFVVVFQVNSGCGFYSVIQLPPPSNTCFCHCNGSRSKWIVTSEWRDTQSCFHSARRPGNVFKTDRL